MTSALQVSGDLWISWSSLVDTGALHLINRQVVFCLNSIEQLGFLNGSGFALFHLKQIKKVESSWLFKNSKGYFSKMNVFTGF